jgi:hypothetical protein
MCFQYWAGQISQAPEGEQKLRFARPLRPTSASFPAVHSIAEFSNESYSPERHSPDSVSLVFSAFSPFSAAIFFAFKL